MLANIDWCGTGSSCEHSRPAGAMRVVIGRAAIDILSRMPSLQPRWKNLACTFTVAMRASKSHARIVDLSSKMAVALHSENRSSFTP